MKNIEAYKALHESRAEFGTGTGHFSYIIALHNHLLPESILDFACGKGHLADQLSEVLGTRIDKYDPAVPSHDKIPNKKYDLLLNTDVLEHIPEDELDKFLKQIKAHSKIAILIPHLELSGDYLPDGTNVHCTIKTKSEWRSLLEGYWESVEEYQHHNKQHAIYVVGSEKMDNKNIRAMMLWLRKVEKEKQILQGKTFTGFIGRLLDLIGMKYTLRRILKRA